MSNFTNPNDPDGRKTRETLGIWLLQLLDADGEQTVFISEVGCSTSGCLHTETIFSVGDQVFNIPKPMVYIRKRDLQQAVETPNVQHSIHRH